jgi:hypothetical protein
MKKEKQKLTTTPHPIGQKASNLPATSRFWRRLPAVVKIVLAVPLVMALLGAEVELRLSPQFDVVATAAGICAIWVWLFGGPSVAA